jgi:hypothetical protein
MNELDYLLSQPRDTPLADSTILSYRTTYKNLGELTKPLNKLTISEIKDLLEKFKDTSLSYRLKILNLVIVIKQAFGRKLSDKITKELRCKLSCSYAKEKQTTIEKTDAVWNEIDAYIDDMYDTDLVKYVTNYLLWEYGVRNMDVDVTIVKHGNEFGGNSNFLVIYPKYIKWIRNSYKTAKDYGEKVIDIHDVRFVTAVKKLYEDGVVKLLDVAKNSLGSKIKRMTYKQLGEVGYLRQNLLKYTGDTNKQLWFEKTRGSSIKNLVTCYNPLYKEV